MSFSRFVAKEKKIVHFHSIFAVVVVVVVVAVAVDVFIVVVVVVVVVVAIVVVSKKEPTFWRCLPQIRADEDGFPAGVSPSAESPRGSPETLPETSPDILTHS